MVTKFDSASLVDQGSPLHPAVIEFARGTDNATPSAEVIETAQHITEAALADTVEPEISVDEDGALSLDLRLSSGLRMLAELPIDGSLDVGYTMTEIQANGHGKSSTCPTRPRMI